MSCGWIQTSEPQTWFRQCTRKGKLFSVFHLQYDRTCSFHSQHPASLQPFSGYNFLLLSLCRSREVWQHQLLVRQNLKFISKLLQLCPGLWLLFSVQQRARKMRQNIWTLAWKRTQRIKDQLVRQRLYDWLPEDFNGHSEMLVGRKDFPWSLGV